MVLRTSHAEFRVNPSIDAFEQRHDVTSVMNWFWVKSGGSRTFRGNSLSFADRTPKIGIRYTN